jgi:hypothetical protein
MYDAAKNTAKLGMAKSPTLFLLFSVVGEPNKIQKQCS